MAIKIGTDLVSCINQATNGGASTINDNVWYDSKNNKLKTYLGEITFDKTKKLIPANTNFSDTTYVDVGTGSNNPTWKSVYKDGTVNIILESGFTFYNDPILIRFSKNLYLLQAFLNVPRVTSTNTFKKVGNITKINNSTLSIPSGARKNCTNGAGYFIEHADADLPFRSGTSTVDFGGGIYCTVTNNHGSQKSEAARWWITLFLTFTSDSAAEGKAL